MFFNSLVFILFFCAVFLCYWSIKERKTQNIFLLLCSYIFYAYWDWRFLSLLLFSTSLDYFFGLRIDETPHQKQKKAWLITSVCINLGFLGFFKYFNFFITSFADMLLLFGIKNSVHTLNIILPLGISFYTFHGLSYVFDIYRGKAKPTRNVIDYSLFVSFFPLLIAGPIERATHFLPQIQTKRNFDYAKAVSGMRQIIWGFFKKLVIADACGSYADQIFNNMYDYRGSTLLLSTVFFTLQVYGDFSGYSDIALGTARLLGFELLRNFNYPFFSQNIAEYWRRWHISLSTWLRDYIYIPLGGNRRGKLIKIRNIFIVFICSGFWHGANWTFIIWGTLHAIFLVPGILFPQLRSNPEAIDPARKIPRLKELCNMLLTFALVATTRIFYRSENVHQAFNYIKLLCTKSIFSVPQILPIRLFCFIAFFIWIEWMGRNDNYALERFGDNKSRVFRWGFYALLVFLIGMYMQTSERTFIYFQF